MIASIVDVDRKSSQMILRVQFTQDGECGSSCGSSEQVLHIEMVPNKKSRWCKKENGAVVIDVFLDEESATSRVETARWAPPRTSAFRRDRIAALIPHLG